jgi:hypothetical protein
VRPDDLRHFIHPFALRLFCGIFLDAREDDAVGPFNGSIGLWVVHRSEAQLGSQLRTELSESGEIELLAIVDGDLLRDAEAAYDILPEKLL